VAFASLDLDPRLNRALADRGFERTTAIQSAAIPAVLAGTDIIGCAQTGTGKTAAFLLPVMQRLLTTRPPALPSTRVLVLAPTRELALQIEDEFQGLGYHTGLTGATVYGGVAAGNQERALRAPVDVVVATPGRLLDHMGSTLGLFEGLEVLILDEADRMLDMGFWPSVRRIVSALPAQRQTLFFSATMSDDVFRSALQIMRDPKLIEVGRTSGLATNITHQSHRLREEDKASWLAKFLRRVEGPTLVFVRTRRGADRLARRLAATGVRCAPLHADLTQSQRAAAVEGFKAARYTTLVATDVAARGLDIEGIAHVVNYEVPDTPDAYVHRVGRTGRADAAGIALTLVTHDELETFRTIERTLELQMAEAGAPPHAAAN
jgi:ATP-dependent RNA helicase RhlE